MSMLTGWLLAGKKYTAGQAVRLHTPDLGCSGLGWHRRRASQKLGRLCQMKASCAGTWMCSVANIQFAGVVITAGIVLATLSAPSRRSAPSPSSAAKDAVTPNSAADTALFVIGIAMLCTALFMSALLGLWQEKIYKVYGTVWQEGLLYSVCLSDSFVSEPGKGVIAL